MSTTNRITKSARGPKPKLKLRFKPHIEELLQEDMNSSSEPSQTSSPATEGVRDKSSAFHEMLEELPRADAHYRHIKDNSTSKAILGLKLGFPERKALRCLLKLPKEKLLVLSKALGEPSKHAAIRGSLDYEQTCDRLESGFNRLSANEQREIRQYLSPTLVRSLKKSQDHHSFHLEVKGQARSSGQLCEGVGSRKNAGIENLFVSSHSEDDNQLFVPQD